MPATTYRTETHYGATVHIIKTTPGNIQMKLIQKSIWDSTGDFGINANFFGSLTQILGICINGNTPVGSWSQDNGSTNGSQLDNKLYSRGTLAYYNDGSLRVETVHHFNELPNYTNIVWAVGGGELFLTQTLTETQFKNSLEASPRYWDYSGTLSGYSDRGRSGIGYDLSGNVYLFGVSNETGFQGVTMYEFRDIAKRIGCYKGIFLDGGSSAQLKWSDGVELYGHGGITRTPVPTIIKLRILKLSRPRDNLSYSEIIVIPTNGPLNTKKAMITACAFQNHVQSRNNNNPSILYNGFSRFDLTKTLWRRLNWEKKPYRN